MLFKLGRLLQLAGLLILPIAISGNLARPEEFSVGWELGLCLVGVGIFTLGWLLQQATRPK
jgi:hypothetical protein